MSRNASPAADWQAAVPVLFVMLWSTGFIGAKLGLPYAEPFTFLSLRFAIVAALMGAVVLLTRSRWPASVRECLHIAMSGALVHGVYLGAVFAAIFHGMSAGVSAVIVGAQPLLTAVLIGPMLGERLAPREWLGLVLGFGGVVLVLWQSIDIAGAHTLGFVLSIGGLFGITLGTLYQKKFCTGMDLRSGSFIQYIASGLMMLPLAFLLETRAVEWSGEFIFALTWLVLVLSVGAVTLLWVLIRRGAAARVASLFYLVPPSVAIMSYFLFDERLGALAIAGIGFTALGVALVNTSRR